MASAEARQRADAVAPRALAPLAPLAWGLAAAAAGASVAPLEPSLLEEGIVVHAAERIASGEHLFRDILLHTGPLPYELLGRLFRIFGARIEVARVAVVVLQALGTAALFAALRRAGLRAQAHAAAAVWVAAPLLLFPLYSTFFYSTLASYLALLVVYAGVRALGSTAWAVATGALVAAIALSKQTTGVLIAAALLPALVAGADRGARRARALGYAAGGAAVALATLALFAARGDLGALLFAQIGLPWAMGGGSGFHMPFINLWPPGELDVFTFRNSPMYFPFLYLVRYGMWEPFSDATVLAVQLLYALPFAVLAASALRLLPPFGRAHPIAWIHGAVALAMAANLFPRSDWGHLVVALPPAAVQLLLLPAGASRRPGPARVAAALAAVLAAGVLVGGVRTLTWLGSVAGPPSFGPRVPLRPVSEGYRTPAVPRVIAYLRERVSPGEAIFVARQEPLLYFATGTRNPTPFPGVLPGVPDLQEDAILEALGSLRFVVMSDIDQAIHAYYSQELPRVWRHLERHFEVAADFPLDTDSWIVVLRRGPDRGATALDLVDAAPGARSWLRDGTRRKEVGGSPPRLLPRRLRRPLAVPVGRLGGGLDFPVEVPDGAVFQADVGLASVTSLTARYGHPPGATAVVSAGRAGVFEELAALPIGEPGERWRPLEVDLSALAGERLTLRLEMRLAAPLENVTFAWWGSPRIALRGG